MISWQRQLPRELINRAYRAGQELAWPRADALMVLSVLHEKGFVVLGVDVWIATSPGPTIPTPYVYDWQLGPDQGSVAGAASAVEFVRDFQWDHRDRSHGGREPHFALTVAPFDG
jgi:hypothetical protein